jgi:hypothetical protein
VSVFPNCLGNLVAIGDLLSLLAEYGRTCQHSSFIWTLRAWGELEDHLCAGACQLHPAIDRCRSRPWSDSCGELDEKLESQQISSATDRTKAEGERCRAYVAATKSKKEGIVRHVQRQRQFRRHYGGERRRQEVLRVTLNPWRERWLA